MKAYSLDLRHKIVSTYKNGEGSVRGVAARFKVAPSFVQKIIKQDKQTGNIVALPRGGTKSKLSEYLDLIENFLTEKNDASLKEICDFLEKTQGLKISISSMCRFLIKNNLTRKKKLSRQTSGNRKSSE